MFPATSMPDRDWWQTLWPNPEQAMRIFGLNLDNNVIDLCCGDGFFTIPLSKIVAKVFAVELDDALLEQARCDAAENNVTNCQWIHGDAMKLSSLIDEKVDFVLLANTFHGIPDKVELVNSVAEMLKPGGQFAIINWYNRPREDTKIFDIPRGPKTEMRLSPEQLSDIMLSCGFELKHTVDVSLYHYASIFVKH